MAGTVFGLWGKRCGHQKFFEDAVNFGATANGLADQSACSSLKFAVALEHIEYVFGHNAI